MKYFILAIISLIFASLTYAQNNLPTTKAANLEDYQLILGPQKIKHNDFEMSGLCYNVDRNSLFTISDNRIIAELELDGTIKRIFPTSGFDDIEGIAYLGNNTFYIAEERRGAIFKVKIDANTKTVKRDQKSAIQVDNITKKNKGLEGLCYDPSHNRLFSVKEKSLPQAYQIVLPVTSIKSTPKVDVLWNAFEIGLNETDFSAIHYHASSGNLLITSHESKSVVEVKLNGQQISRLLLRKGNAKLNADIPQVEGITMDNKGNLYLCSEPNLLYVFSKSR